MARLQVVLLLVASCIATSLGQFSPQLGGGLGGFPQGGLGGIGGGLGGGLGGGGLPGIGGGLFPGFGGPQGGFPGAFPGLFQQRAFQQPQILTCIGRNEAYDHLKITLRPEPSGFSSSAFQYGAPQARVRELRQQDWRISAVYIPAASLGTVSPAGTTSLVGQFFLAVTRFGRTDGSCAGLGGILQNEDEIEDDSSFGGLGGNPYLRALGQGSPFGQLGGQFGGQGGLAALLGQSGYGGSFQDTPAGFIQDPIVISQGGNVYSGVIRDISEADLRGRGIAVCLDYLCQRPTTTCCTIAKDSLPATEVIGGAVPVGPYSGATLLNGLQGGGGGAGSLGTLGGGGSTGLF